MPPSSGFTETITGRMIAEFIDHAGGDQPASTQTPPPSPSQIGRAFWEPVIRRFFRKKPDHSYWTVRIPPGIEQARFVRSRARWEGGICDEIRGTALRIDDEHCLVLVTGSQHPWDRNSAVLIPWDQIIDIGWSIEENLTPADCS